MNLANSIKNLGNYKFDGRSISADVSKISNDGVFECIDRSHILDETEFNDIRDVVKKKGATVKFKVSFSNETELIPVLRVVLNNNSEVKETVVTLSEEEESGLFSMLEAMFEKEEGYSIFDFLSKLYEENAENMDLDSLYRYLSKGVAVNLGLNGETCATVNNNTLEVYSNRMKILLTSLDNFNDIPKDEVTLFIASVYDGDMMCNNPDKFKGMSIAEAVHEIDKDVIESALSQVFDEDFAKKIIKDFGGIYRD